MRRLGAVLTFCVLLWLAAAVVTVFFLAAEARERIEERMRMMAPPTGPIVMVVQATPADAPRAVTVPASAWRWMRVEATAYTSGPESTGKRPGDPGYGVTYSGVPARAGVVAVDPEVIPLGSVLYVEGYGLAVALDTGRAIRGRRIDVWFADVETARRWGRRTVWVGVLDAHSQARVGDVAFLGGE